MLYPNPKELKTKEMLSNKFSAFLFDEKSKEAREYLKERGISKDMAIKFRLGYCPRNVNFKNKFLNNMKGRVIFPIMDEFGQIVALSGRVIKKEDKRSKWFHESFQKSFFLYGMHDSWRAILEEGFVFVVEGQMDVLSMKSNGIENTVGVLGSELTQEAFIKLARITDKIVTVFDGDKAGIEAAKKTSDFLADYRSCGYSHINVPMKFAGEECDPDDFLKKYGKDKFLKIVAKQEEKKEEDELDDMFKELLKCQ